MCCTFGCRLVMELISLFQYIYICLLRFPRMGSMLLEIFPVSPRGFESFTRRFGSPLEAIFKRGGGWSTWS